MIRDNRHIIPDHESETVEFKATFQDGVIETLVAFANAKGGTVYVGVDDHGKAKGLEVGKETLQKWLNDIKLKTQPALIPIVEVIDVADKFIVAFIQNEYPIKPVAFRGKYYKRTRAANHLLSVAEVAEMHLRTVNSSWDYYMRNGSSIVDISREKVQRVIDVIAKRNPGYTIDSVDEFLNKHQLVDADAITNGCFLMFTAKDTYRTTIQMGFFASEIVIKDDVTNTMDIVSQVDEVMQFIIKHINKEIIVTGRPENTERWQYPLEGLRELVINMIAHRDYMSGMHSTIKIFPDSIVLFNPGSLPGHITLADLLSDNYISSPRNLQISKVFKEMGLIERYGTGIKKVRRLFLNHNLPEPEFRMMQDGFFVRIFGKPAKNRQNASEDVNVGANVGVNVGANVGANELFILIKAIPGMNSKTIKQHFQVTERTIERWLKQLREEGKVEFKGAAKTGGYYIIE